MIKFGVERVSHTLILLCSISIVRLITNAGKCGTQFDGVQLYRCNNAVMLFQSFKAIRNKIDLQKTVQYKKDLCPSFSCILHESEKEGLIEFPYIQ